MDSKGVPSGGVGVDCKVGVEFVWAVEPYGVSAKRLKNKHYHNVTQTNL